MNMITGAIGTIMSDVPFLNTFTKLLGMDDGQGGDSGSSSPASVPQDSCDLSQEDDNDKGGAGAGLMAKWGNDAPGSASAAGASSTTAAQSGQPLPEELKMPTQILENVVLASGKVQSQDKGALKQCIDGVQHGGSLDNCLKPLSSNQKCELEGAIAGAGFKPPEQLKKYSKDPSNDYSPLRLDCALRNVENYQQTGSLQGTQAYQLTHLIPIVGPLVSKVLDVGLGFMANLQSNCQGLGASSGTS